ncbi:MAG: hypothetical protein ABL974_16710 [Prosthecobacter sp.]
MKRLIPFLFVAVFQALPVQAQGQPDSTAGSTGAEPTTERIQYALILPEEKTPEMVKPEDNNPFEVTAGDSKTDVDSEENRVRDILLGMSAVGGGFDADGMRVMLGSMRLEAGQMVPNVLPDQQVMLKVKSVSPTAIELVWVEKRPTGLPPKPFVINVDVSPKVRYRMPSGTNTKAGGDVGTMQRDDVSAFIPRKDESEQAQVAVAVKAVAVDDPPKAESAAPVPTNVPEASVLRMLFGNHAAPPPKK